jgi:hypothetical protein
MPPVKAEDKQQSANQCPAEIEFLAQLEKISIRHLHVVELLNEYRSSPPLRQKELKVMIEGSLVSEQEIGSLWEAFQAHRTEHGCQGLLVPVDNGN